MYSDFRCYPCWNSFIYSTSDAANEREKSGISNNRNGCRCQTIIKYKKPVRKLQSDKSIKTFLCSTHIILLRGLIEATLKKWIKCNFIESIVEIKNLFFGLFQQIIDFWLFVLRPKSIFDSNILKVEIIKNSNKKKTK